MRVQFVVSMVTLLSVLAVPQSQGGQPACPNAANCAQVGLGGPSGARGATVGVPFTFTQGPGGSPIGQIAAIAFTVTMPTGATAPLTLADCGSNSDGTLPNAVVPDGSLANFKLVVENAYCSPTRTHCLCPDAGSGISADNFMNVVIYGPNPLPTPGPTPIAIPTLPSGPQLLFTANFKVSSGAGGVIPLHVLNQVDDKSGSISTGPAFTALLSVGDVNAVDQTCVPQIPPCHDANGVSQVVVTDGRVLVTNGCTGSCDYSGQVTVDKILTMVNIALGNQSIGSCWAGDADGNGQITIDEILAAVNNALNGCPAA
jgi:hypothetical protein